MSEQLSITAFEELQADLLVEIAGHISSFVDLCAFLSTSKKLWALIELPEITTACLSNRSALQAHQLKRLLSSRSPQHILSVTKMLMAAGVQQQQDFWVDQQNWDEWALIAVELGLHEVADLLYSTLVMRCRPAPPADVADDDESLSRPHPAVGANIRYEVPSNRQPLPRRSAGPPASGLLTAASSSHAVRITRHSADPAAAVRLTSAALIRASPSQPIRLTASQAAALKSHAPSLTTPSMASSSTSQAESTFSLAMPSMRILQRNSRNLNPNIRGAPSSSGPQLAHRSPATSSSSPDPIIRSRPMEYTHPEDCEGPQERQCFLADVHFIGDAPLRHACHAGNLNLVRMLLEHGADMHAREGMPLALASGGGHVEVVKFLIEEAGANVAIGNHKALAAAIASTKPCHLQILCMLLEAGANVHASDNFALRWACSHGRLEVAKLLLEHGADIHAGSEDALYQAAKNGHQDVVQLLLAQGADPARCQDAIRRAEERGHSQVAAMLKLATRKGLMQRIFKVLICSFA